MAKAKLRVVQKNKTPKGENQRQRKLIKALLLVVFAVVVVVIVVVNSLVFDM